MGSSWMAVLNFHDPSSTEACDGVRQIQFCLER